MKDFHPSINHNIFYSNHFFCSCSNEMKAYWFYSISKNRILVLSFLIFLLFDLTHLTSSIDYSGTNCRNNNDCRNNELALTLSLDDSPSIRHKSVNRIDHATNPTIPCLFDRTDLENSAQFLTLPGLDPESAIERLMAEQAKMKTKSIGKNILIPTIRNNRLLPLSHLKATILTIAMITSILARSWSLFAVSAILYFLEASICSTRRYLSNTESPATILDYVHNLRRTQPKVKWTIQCYHYRTHTTTGRNGKRTTHRTKIVTYRASEDYRFQNWKDLTQTQIPFLEDVLSVKSLQTLRFVKISCFKTIFMDHATMMDYFNKQKLFFDFNSRRDWHTELFTSLQGTVP